MAEIVTVSASDLPSLGDINDEGMIYTTCGWSTHGPAWVLDKQIAPTVGYGWQRTGKTAPFQGVTLHELTRSAPPEAP